MINKIKDHFITNQNKWVSYEDIKKVLNDEYVSKGQIRKLISDLRNEGFIVISKKRIGWKLIDPREVNDKYDELKVIEQAQEEIKSAKRRLKIYNKWINDIVHKELEFNEEFVEFLNEERLASGTKATFEDFVNNLTQKEMIEYWKEFKEV